ncbi:UNVERIFIED_CONTAM: hypothetical protein HDU68_007016 [Siphonaria sp. JEL0065]|nr:hypothetical protein HDU68_007016 [Siphonaria sp. JEL0065]
MWHPAEAIPSSDAPVAFSNDDLAFLDSILDNSQCNSNGLAPANESQSMMSSFDPFGFLETSSAPPIQQQLQEYGTPVSNAMNVVAFDFETVARFAISTLYQQNQQHQLLGVPAYNVNAQDLASLVSIAAPWGPITQSPQLSYPMTNFFSSPISMSTTPAASIFQQSCLQTPAMVQSPVSTFVNVTPVTEVLHNGSPLRTAPRKPAPKRRTVSHQVGTTLVSQSVIRNGRNNSTPSVAPYPTGIPSPPSRMTPSLLMAQAQSDTHGRMTPSTFMNLAPSIASSPMILSLPSPTSPQASHIKIESMTAMTPNSFFHTTTSFNHTAVPSLTTGSFNSAQAPKQIARPPPKTLEEKRLYRKEAEKARRELMKASFDIVKEILPHNSFREKLPSKEKVLDAASNYILDLMKEEAAKAQVVADLEREVRLLKIHGGFSFGGVGLMSSCM